MYHKKTYDCGRAVVVIKYYPVQRGPKEERGKRARSPDEIRRWDSQKRARTVQRLILANFVEDDYHLTLTYRQDERPESLEEAKKRLSTFIGKMRAAYKKKDLPFKWVAVTEQGQKGAYHHHLIIQNIRSGIDTDKLVRKCWPWGRPMFVLLDDGDYEQLADYLVKKETKEKEEPGKNQMYYSRSRNLIVPQQKIEKIYQKRWKPEPKAPKGFEIEKGSVVSGENPVTGMPWQRYILIRTTRRRP